jgi:hypothetical protein
VSVSRLRAALERVEAELGERILSERLENCNCRADHDQVLVTDPGKFEALMNIPCEVHGVRALGQFGIPMTVGGKRPPKELEIERLIELYHQRREQKRLDAAEFGDELEK